MRSTCSLLPAALAACADPPSPRDDHAAYAALLHADELPVAERMEACLDLADRANRGDCALVTAESAPRRGGGPIEGWCREVPRGAWRHECWFQASEQARREHDLDRALALCQRSGPFRTDCRQHLWQGALHGTVPPQGPWGFAGGLEPAEVVLHRFAPLLDDDPDFEDRFWFRWFQEGFERAPGLDLAACDPLPGEMGTRCRAAGTDLYRTRLDRALFSCEACRKAFCTRAAAAPAVQDVLGFELGLLDGNPGSVATPSPALDAVVADSYARHCGAATGRAPPP